ncbi:MAG: ABC transporter permease [Phycisphaerales bacterium]|nr:ABC transporter permease [Phycisphaerales bacterium]
MPNALVNSPLLRPIRALGALVWIALRGPITTSIKDFGRFARFAYWTLRGMPFVKTWSRGDRLRSQLFFVGTTSVPVLMITGSFIGMILAIEGYLQFAAIGQEGRLGGVINISLTKQIGPVLAAVMLAGRVGCALTAELGTMRVTEQLDAMRAMAADPIRVLVIPRVVACFLMIPILTVVSNLCGVMGGWFIVTRYFDADATTYWRYTAEFVAWTDLANGLVKSVVFGLMIGLISCYKGFHCRPGAEGVGRATTDSFVTSFMAIIMSNLFLAKVLNDLDLMYHGGLMRKIFS